MVPLGWRRSAGATWTDESAPARPTRRGNTSLTRGASHSAGDRLSSASQLLQTLHWRALLAACCLLLGEQGSGGGSSGSECSTRR